jgi:hypothetical protein
MRPRCLLEGQLGCDGIPHLLEVDRQHSGVIGVAALSRRAGVVLVLEAPVARSVRSAVLVSRRAK